MRFSTHGSVAVAMAASFASAHYPPPQPSQYLDLPTTGDLSKPISADIDLNCDLSGKVLVAGVIADVTVDPIAGIKADAKVDVACEDCHIKGSIDALVSLEKAKPALSLSLKDVEVLLDLDVYIGAAATIAVNLFTPAKVSFPIPGLNIEALVHLDLILGVHTELDLSAGVYVSLPEATLETDIFDGEILGADFSGVAVKVLPVEVRIGCTELLADLRLRVDLAVAAEVDVDDILPLDQLLPGLNIPAVGAGLELAVFANLLEYVGFFCAAPECPLAKESYGLNVGVAVELDVAVEDLLSIHLAPTIATTLLSIPTTTICIPSYTSLPISSGIPSSVSASVGLSTSSAEPTSSGSAASSASASSSGLSSPSGPASSSGLPTSVSLPSSVGLPTSVSLPTSVGLPTSSGVPTSGAQTSSAGLSTSIGLPTSTGGSATAVSSTGAASGSTGASIPGASVTTSALGSGYVTSTISAVETYTVTACALNLPNCPAGYQTGVTVVHTTSYTTVCPVTATESITALPVPTSTGGHSIVSITKHVTTMVPCETTSTFVPPTNFPTAPYPTGKPTVTASYPAGSSPATPSASSPAGGSPGGPIVGSSAVYPSASYSASGPAGSSPAGAPSASYPAGGASASYPAGGPSASYPAGGSPAGAPSASYPAGGPSASYPAGGSGGSGSAPGAPTPAPYPTAPAYPTGGNSTIAQTWTTYQPSASLTQTTASYPTGPAGTPPVVAGAGKIGSGVGVLAFVGAIVALM
ncbi:hypothetical protein F5Y19DRAFT_142458 [Xylariaceae sp. FL1651]|nr:hypothetical protein F5Y19DRAFT_142458 [Xylariaceae sp. FL1651]